ncbi:hypothetical protein [Azotobacter beijerinckii]|uniref:hypothetical protein n=1 Tax=Azotobacter beijerinckii TaxID=170623 RepID=UPI00147B77DA|nr:hypothetical protein [Azotobacter beijerinckii]
MPQQYRFDHFGQLHTLLKKATGWTIRSACMTTRASLENISLAADSPEENPSCAVIAN